MTIPTQPDFSCPQGQQCSENAPECFTVQQAGQNNVSLSVIRIASLVKLNRNILFTYFGPDTNLNLLGCVGWEYKVHWFSTQL